MKNIQERSVVDTKHLLKRLGVKPGMRVADIGSGGHPNYVGEISKQLGRDGELFAVDIRKSALSALASHCRHNNISITPVWADAEVMNDTGLPNEHCDRVLLINTLHQSNSIESMLREAARLLHPHGSILIIDWQSNGLLKPTAGKLLASSEIVRNANNLGLHLTQHFEASPNHYGLIFSKL